MRDFDAKDEKAKKPDVDEVYPIKKGTLLRRLRDTYDRIEMIICITMYNEDWVEFKGTMAGISHNIAELMKQYGDDFQDKVLILLISDGYDKLFKDKRKDSLTPYSEFME
jgi:hypothetical protein